MTNRTPAPHIELCADQLIVTITPVCDADDNDNLLDAQVVRRGPCIANNAAFMSHTCHTWYHDQ